MNESEMLFSFSDSVSGTWTT